MERVSVQSIRRQCRSLRSRQKHRRTVHCKIGSARLVFPLFKVSLNLARVRYIPSRPSHSIGKADVAKQFSVVRKVDVIQQYYISRQVSY